MSSNATPGRLSTKRLPPFEGYQDDPVTYDAMLFLLPHFTLRSVRTVNTGTSTWELWSPNSSSFTFYPGICYPDVSVGSQCPREERRADGHLGRFDYTTSPQHYDQERPWRGFIRKKANDSRPENASFWSKWTPSSRGNTGFVMINFVNMLSQRAQVIHGLINECRLIETSHPKLWNSRPLLPSFLVDSLRNELLVDDALDSFTEIQRYMKDMRAWARMAKAWLQEHSNPSEFPTAVPAADDAFLGVWLNGADEREAWFLLKYQVPCFIVHEVDCETERERVAKHQKRCTKLFTDTDASLLCPTLGEIDLPGVAEGQEFVQQRQGPAIALRSLVPISTRSLRCLSSLEAQGWVSDAYQNPLHVEFPPRMFDLEEVLEDTKGRLIPPPIAKAPVGMNWTRWAQDFTEDNSMCFRRKGGEMAEDHGKYKYYDRNLCRIIVMDNSAMIPKYYDADIKLFGMPCPRVAFFDIGKDTKDVKAPRSVWMYKMQDPLSSDDGMAWTPEDELILAVEEDSDSSSEISLGSEDPPTSLPPLAAKLPETRPNSLKRGRSSERQLSRSGHFHSLPSDAFRQPRRSSPLRLPPRRNVSPDRRMRRDSYYPQRSSCRPFASLSRLPPPRYNRRSPSPRRMRYSSPRQLDSQNCRYEHSYRRPVSPPRRLPSKPPVRRRSVSPRGRRTGSQTPPPVALSNQLRPPTTPPITSSYGLQTRTSSLSTTTIFDSIAPKLHDPVSHPILFNSNIMMELFPQPSSSPVAILDRAEPGAQTKFLVIWNLPNHFSWNTVVTWVSDKAKLAFKSQINSITRTNERGFQVFWMRFKTARDATLFRGTVTYRKITGDILAKCDYVQGVEYGAACGCSTDTWTLKNGFEEGHDGNAPFPNDIRPELKGKISLAERLGFPPLPEGMVVQQKKPSRKKRRGCRGGVAVEVSN